ncbi:MAG: AbgT family transporter [Bacteroidetes bacterium]|nr:AbgT family transporter [Bacteroidota bacterium]
MAKEGGKSKGIEKFLNIIEKAGNALPHPATLFLILALLVLVLSGVLSLFDLEVVHPGTGAAIKPENLLSKDGLHKILLNMVTNFTGFAPLGTVLVAMLGIGIAESSGLIGTGLRLMVLKAPERLLTFVLVFAGVLSNMASEVGYVLLVPLGAIIFLAAGKHPVVGMAAAFAGVSGGYSANLVIGTVDPLLSELSNEAMLAAFKDLPEGYLIEPTANWYFMIGSTFVISLIGTWVTEKLVAPRFGKYTGDVEAEEIKPLSSLEKRGLRAATITTLIIFGIIAIGLIPENGILRNLEKPDEILKSPVFKGIVAFIFLVAGLAGVAYGIAAKTIKSDADVMNGMGKTMSTMGIYIVLVFFAAQFVKYFEWTNLGLITAVKGAEGLKFLLGLEEGQTVNKLDLILVAIPFILLAAVINLIMGSASAKWGLMAPVFIPMFMLIGISPEMTQVAYRIGDSVTNIISPMMSYFALIIAFMQRYVKDAGIGTIIATMLPYSVVFFIAWVAFLIIWILLGIPLGPDAGFFIDVPTN